jgi:hypothetical protein
MNNARRPADCLRLYLQTSRLTLFRLPCHTNYHE